MNFTKACFICCLLYPSIHSMSRGYIVFVFFLMCVCPCVLCVCVCVCVRVCVRVCVCQLFSVTNFSGTTTPGVMKFNAYVAYSEFYSGKENWPASAYSSPIICPFFVLSKINVLYDSLYCGKGNWYAPSHSSINYPFFFSPIIFLSNLFYILYLGFWV